MLSKELLSPGYLKQSDDEGYPLSYLAGQLGITTTQLKACLDKYTKHEMITVSDSGCITITNWITYQAVYDFNKSGQVKKEVAAHPGGSQSIDEYLAEISPQYPELDIANELVKFNLYWSEGNRTLKRPKLALKNWLDKAKEFKGNSKKPQQSQGRVQEYDFT